MKLKIIVSLYTKTATLTVGGLPICVIPISELPTYGIKVGYENA